MPCYRICKFNNSKDYNNMKVLREWWEEWDLRILVLYMFISQIYLHFFGRLRRKNASPLLTIASVWLLYLFADLLAIIALGKLSKVKVDENDNDDATKTMGAHVLRVLWAPIILFYLGGPDTITVLRVEENKLWVRHLIGLLTQGIRVAYVLIVTWNTKGLSLLAVLMFVPGIIKYGERVWVVRSRSKGNYKGFVEIDLSRIDKISASRPNAKLVLLAHSCFQTLMPHNPTYKCNPSKVSFMVTKFHESMRTEPVDALKLIEIELGLMYDMLFSKVGTIFTLWGCILRFLSFSLIVSVLVIFLTRDKPRGYLKGDYPITIILLAGAIFLEIAGVVVQLVSDWAMVWACKSPRNWGTSILFLHEYLISSKIQRWSGVIGQFSFRDFCTNYKPTMCNSTWEFLFGREKMLKRFSSQLSLAQHLKGLIIIHLLEKSERIEDVDTLQTSTQKIANVDNLGTSIEKIADVDTVQTSTKKVADVDGLPSLFVARGGRTLSRNQLEEQLKWSIDLEFNQSIVIWHVATQLCYDSDHPGIVGKEQVKALSDYMMYLLVACHDTFPFSDKYDKITEYYVDIKELFDGIWRSNSKGVEREGDDADSITQVNEARRLFQALEGNPKKWEIMGGVWVEMLCFAAKTCPVKNHIQELRHGGEFLTHIWLLLMHFGVTKKSDRSKSSRKDEYDSGAKGGAAPGAEIEADKVEKGKYRNGGIQATHEELEEDNVADDWKVQEIS